MSLEDTGPRAEPPEYGEFLLHLGIDLVFVAILLYAFFRRHRRRDLVMSFACFNVGFVVVLGVIFSIEIGLAVAFGLFAILSIVRLRSEPYNNIELGYYFVALALALVNGMHLDDVPFVLLLNVVLVLTTLAMDRPTFVEGTERRVVTLDAAYPDAESAHAALSERMRAEVIDVAISEVDYVRETTRLTALIAPAAVASKSSGAGS